MQKWLAQNRSRLPAATGALVALAFGAKLILGNGEAARLIFLAASLLGILPIAYEAVQALKVHVVSIDLLVTIAMLGAFAIQEYEGSAAVAFLFLFGAYREQRTLAKTRSAIHGLTEMVPETALRKTDGSTFEETDIVQVQTGGKDSVDGRCLPAREPWTSRASQASRCRLRRRQEARSLPARFWPMARPSLWQKGLARIRHSAGSPSSSRRHRTRRLRQSASSTASRSTTRLSCLPLPSLSGPLPAIWSLRSRFSCSAAPGTLVVGVPVSNVAGIGNGTKHGILFKGSDAATRFSYVCTMLFDKIGTLTYGKPKAVQGLFL